LDCAAAEEGRVTDQHNQPPENRTMTTPTMKMTTEIPAQITTPDSVETRLGTLKFFDGFPEDATVVLFPRSLRLTEFHLTGRDIETRFVGKFAQEQNRRNHGKKENTSKFSERYKTP